MSFKLGCTLLICHDSSIISAKHPRVNLELSGGLSTFNHGHLRNLIVGARRCTNVGDDTQHITKAGNGYYARLR